MLPPIPPGARLNEPEKKLPPIPKGAKLVRPRGMIGSRKALDNAPLIPTGEVVDGDTFRLQDSANARLFGADAFELRQTGTVEGQIIPLGEMARDSLGNIAGNNASASATGTASFGRPVAILQGNGVDAGRSQIADGLAIPALDYMANQPQMAQDYVTAQRDAIGAERGAYAGQYQEPSAYRKQGVDAPVVGKVPMSPEQYKEYSALLRDSNTTPEKLEQWSASHNRNIANAPELLSFIRRNPNATISQYWQQEDVQGAPVVKDGQNVATRHTQALNEGIIDTLGFPVDIVNMGLDAAGVPVSDKPFLGSAQIRDIAHSFGIGQADESTAPRSDVERYTQAFARGTGQAVVPVAGSLGAGGRLATRAPSLLTQASPTRQAARSSLVDAARAPGATIAAETGGAVGANLAGEAAQDYAPGNPYAQIAAQTVGGLAGGVAGFRLAPGQRPPSALDDAPRVDDLPPIPEGAVLNDVSKVDKSRNLADGPLELSSANIAADTGLTQPTLRSDLMASTRPLLQDNASPQFNMAAGRVSPDDVLPIPASQVDGIGEAAQIDAGRFEPLKPVDERSLLETNAFRSQSNPEKLLPTKGPIDLVSFIRKQGGVVDQGGDLASMGLGNGRRNIDFAQNDTKMGPLIAQNGNTLDDMAHEAWEAGYFPDHVTRPTVEEFIEAVGETYGGYNRRFLPDDFEQVDTFYAQQRLNNDIGKAAEDGAPMVADKSYPVELSDLDVPPLTAYEDWPAQGVGRIGNINVGNLNSPQDIQRALKATDNAMGGFDAATRGKVTNEATERLAGDLGMTADNLLARRKGQAFNAEEALAARQILAKSGNELVNAARALKRTDNPGDEALAAFREKWVRHAAIQEQVSGATAEAGRALQAFRIAADSKDAPANVLRGLVGAGGGGNRLQDAAEAIIDLAENPGQLNSFSEKAMKPGFKEMAVELWYNFLLSGPQTHVVNMTSNTLTALAQIPEHAVAATIGGSRRAFSKKASDRVLFSEVGARSVGLIQGIREGLPQMIRTFRTGEPSDAVTKVEDLAQKAIPGKVGEVLRIPTRALAAEDELFKAMARRMELSGLAVRQAKSEGLRGKEGKQRVADLMANPPDEMLAKSFDYGRYLTFTKPLSENDGALSALGSMASRATEVVPPLKAILPFVRTPTNLLKFSLERSPFAPAMKDWRRDFKAGGARRDLAVARAMIGTGMAALIAEYAAEGKITGSPPADRMQERLLRADGWQPYSFVVGEKYYSYLRLDPFASTIGTAADVATANNGMTDKQREHGATLTVTSILSNLSNKTWLTGISDALAAMREPERNVEWFAKRLAGSATVPTGVAQVARFNDPTFRETETATDYIKSRIPGAGADLPAKRDFWGQPIVGEGGLGPDFISPIWQSTRQNDPVTNELIRVGVRSGAPQQKDMTGHEYADFQERAGALAKERVSDLIDSAAYWDLSDEEKNDTIKKIISKSRKDAKAGAVSNDLPPIPPGATLNGLPPIPPGAVLNKRDDLPPIPAGARLN